jgi:hypothetical protein
LVPERIGRGISVLGHAFAGAGEERKSFHGTSPEAIADIKSSAWSLVRY